MKQTRLALALVVTSLATTPVLAASMTMLQFGSFETREEAEKRLTEVTGKYSDSVGKLPTNIREVKLPPDNLTVYRTQAGPVADRAAAQSICSKLASTGDECYIVQTAMVNAPAAPAVASNAATSPIAAELDKAKNDAVASTGATPDLTSKLSTLNSGVATRDASSRAALNSINTPLTATADASAATISPLPAAAGTNAEPVLAAEPSPQMKAALDQAVADQPKVAASLNETTATADTTTAERRGFWSRLNPFSSSAKPAPTAIVQTPAPTAAPVESVTTQAIEAPVAAAPAAMAAPVVVAAAAPTPAPAAAFAQPAAGFDNTTTVVTQAAPMQLPPPPAPLKAQDRAALTAGKTAVAAPEPVAAPITNAPITVAAAPAVAGAGSVQVEEAKRVPVTEAYAPSATPQAVPHAAPFQQAPVSLNPASTNGRKTIWAQIGPFKDNDAALAYWANYRQNYPDFPVVRVRVTSPFQQAVQNKAFAWLRIGPIANTGFVTNLCNSLAAPAPGEQPLRCGVVTDMGTGTSLRPAAGMLPNSRYSKH